MDNQDATWPTATLLLGEQPGRRRIHKTPRRSEIKACLGWTEAEIEAVGPVVATWHPSAVLRASQDPERARPSRPTR